MGMSNRDLVLVVVAVLAVVAGGVYLFMGTDEECVPEDGCITVGVQHPTGECCEGLIPKAPVGFTGGAWCLKPECPIECIQGVSGEGWYDICTQKMLLRDDCHTPPEPSKCLSNSDCNGGAFCEYKVAECGGWWGTCVEKPTICPTLWQPVCGCDYHTYPNDCNRQAAGISKLHEWSCESRDHPDPNYCNQGFRVSEFSTGVPVANMWIHLPYQPKVADRMICTNSDGEAYTPILRGSFVKVILEPHEGDECVGGCEWEYIACEKPVLLFKVEEKK